MDPSNNNYQDQEHIREKYFEGKIFRKFLIVSIVLSFFVSSLAGALFGFMAGDFSRKGVDGILAELKSRTTTSQPEKNQSVSKNSLSVVDEESAVIDSVQKASPAVVSIIITKDVPKLNGNSFNPFFDDPFFNPFGFRGQDNSPSQDSGGTQKQEVGGGTGFIADPDGYIITNKHVVEDKSAQYTVIMNDGEKVPAKVLALDPFNDLAVIKIDKNNLPTLELADSDNLKIGQTVIAIGNSLGEFRNTVSKGIISGLKRNVNAGDASTGQSELLEEVIQTDAAINPGNSGGPLLNISGQAIGINVAMAQGAQNIGFALPINQVKKTLQSVKENGKIVRPYIGVRYTLINDQIQKENNLPYNYGALVIRGTKQTDLAVIPGSPADKAGIVENDIILEIDGKKLTDGNDLAKAIRDKNVGDKITLKIWDKGQEKTVTITLEESK